MGAAPYWADGLDLLTRFLDLPVAVIPHYDNAEGGTYDTRFCYLGEDRLHALEGELPDSAAVLGVDEHTAVIVDLVSKTVEVSGVGHLTVRRQARNERIPSGTTLTIDELGAIVAGVRHVPMDTSTVAASTGEPDSDDAGPAPSLDADVAAQRDLFDAAMTSRDVDAAVAALLGLDDVLQAWSADTLQSDSLDRGRRELRAMVVRLGELARAGAADPTVALAPIVESVLAARTAAREDKDFATSDVLRDALIAGGVVVMDTPNGSTWSIEAPNDEGPGAPP